MGCEYCPIWFLLKKRLSKRSIIPESRDINSRRIITSWKEGNVKVLGIIDKLLNHG